jgi:membrane protein YqaA with SNARE-associated domain
MTKETSTEPKKEERLKGIFEIIFGLAIAVIIFLFSDQLKALHEWGYLGVFVISLLSAATILIPAPGWAVTIAMGGILNPVYVGFVAGIGSGLGEISGYVVGRGAKDIGVGNDEKFKKWREWIKSNDLIAISVLAFIPNPAFDVAGLVAGAVGIPLWRFICACIIGRTLRYVLLAYAGAFSLQYL